MSAQAANRPQNGGCLKCGEKGHWARDCTAPREKWLSREYQSQQNNGNTQAIATQNGGNGDPTEGQENNPEPFLGAAAAARQKQKRPKLTYEDLKKSNGLPEIYHNFPTIFKANFKGKGHEVSDLRRLLEMYKRWQDRVFPQGSFDNFIATVEKIGATNIVKKDMSDMRMDLLKTVEDALAPADEPAAASDDIFGGGEYAHQKETAEEEEEVELAINSDDELLELAAAPMTDGELAAAQAVAASGAAGEGDEDMDDEELLEMAMQGNNNTGAVANQTGAVDDGEIDDEELLEMAMQG